MLTINDIEQLLTKMTNDLTLNIKEIKKVVGNLNYKDETNQTLLHLLVDNKFEEQTSFLAIKSLLKFGMNPNAKDDFEYNFIQTALYAGYSENFISNIIKEALKYNLDINHVDSDKDTIMHTAIYSDDYLGEVINIYNLLYDNGFNSTKLDQDGRNLVDAMRFQNQYSENQIKNFEKLFLERTKTAISTKEVQTTNKVSISQKIPISVNASSVFSLSEDEIAELEKYGKILNDKQHISPPSIGREKELKNLIITLAQDKKNPIITGESGVGKTTIVEELAYRIKNNHVPKFLQNRLILEVNPNELVAGCSYVGQFEDKITKLMKLCQKYQLVLFIDEIHTVFGTGSSKNNNNDMATMLTYYIDRAGIRVIGTTTEAEYDTFFASSSLKRRFEKIKVIEPTNDILYLIIDKVINDYTMKTRIILENESIRKEIINIIISITDKKSRIYKDITNNPDLAISIVDTSFAFAKVYDSGFLNIEHIIESINLCSRIYESSKEQAILKLKNLNTNKEIPKSRVLIPFKKNNQ